MLTAKKFAVILLCILLLITVIPENGKAVSVSAYSAILMEQDSGRVLYEQRAHEKQRIASITKIMTAVLAVESGKLDELVTVSERAVLAEGSKIYLQKGEKLKLSDLVYGLMLRSGNDAAVAIAEHVGGSLEGFAFLMNEKADEIGMTNTNFSNPHGLDDSNDHYSTAYDMALLTRYGMQNDMYKAIAGTKVYKSSEPNERVWRNKNRLLTEKYQYCTGGKTGFTQKAGRTLVTTASKGNLDLISVTLDAPDDWQDHIQLFEYGFSSFEKVPLIDEGKIQKKLANTFYEGNIYVKSSFVFPLSKEEENDVRVEYRMLELKEDWLEEPEDIPDIVGNAIVFFHEESIKEIPIYYNTEKTKDSKTWLDWFKDVFTAFVRVNVDG